MDRYEEDDDDDGGGGWTAVALAQLGRWHWDAADQAIAAVAVSHDDLDVVRTHGWLWRVYCFVAVHPETLEALRRALVEAGVPVEYELPLLTPKPLENSA